MSEWPPTLEEVSTPIESGLRPLTEEERKAFEFAPEEAARIRRRLDDLDVHQLNNTRIIDCTRGPS